MNNYSNIDIPQSSFSGINLIKSIFFIKLKRKKIVSNWFLKESIYQAKQNYLVNLFSSSIVSSFPLIKNISWIKISKNVKSSISHKKTPSFRNSKKEKKIYLLGLFIYYVKKKLTPTNSNIEAALESLCLLYICTQEFSTFYLR